MRRLILFLALGALFVLAAPSAQAQVHPLAFEPARVILEDGAPFDVFDKDRLGFSLRGVDCCDGSCGPPHPDCIVDPIANQCFDYCMDACGPCIVDFCRIIGIDEQGNPECEVSCERGLWPPECW